jgi:hypothetical protein
MFTLYSSELVAVLRVLLATTATLCRVVLLIPIITISSVFAAVNLLPRAILSSTAPALKTWGQLIEFEPRFGWKP